MGALDMDFICNQKQAKACDLEETIRLYKIQKFFYRKSGESYQIAESPSVDFAMHRNRKLYYSAFLTIIK